MIKTCSVCKQDKPITEFGVLLRNKDGHAGRCKLCSRKAVAATKVKRGRGRCDPVKAKERKARFHAKNPSYGKDYYWNNRDANLNQSRKYREKNRTTLNALQLAKYREKSAKRKAEFVGPKIPSKILGRIKRRLWHIAHPEQKPSDVAIRRAQKKNATPAWANRFFIREAYHLAKLRTKMTGFKWEVDHIYPLQSDVVCGLHVEHNLQVIPAVLNRQKGNKVIHHG